MTLSFHEGHALLIGVASYVYAPELNVPAVAADAQALAQVLGDPRFCGYPAQQVQLRHGAAATRAELLASLEQLAHTCQEDATLVLLYCGHGAFDSDGAYVLTTHDTRIQNGCAVPGTAIGQRELLVCLRAIRARRVVLLFNACHAGSLAPTLDAAESPGLLVPRSVPDDVGAALLATGSGRVIITSCRAEQLAYVGAGPLTLFTQALVAGLLGKGVVSRAGYVSIFDLYTHVFAQVRDTVEAHYGAVQEPELTVLQGVGPFPIALYRGATALGAGGAPAGPATGAVRTLSEHESQAAYQRIVQVGQGVAVGGDLTGGAAVSLGPHSSISAPVTVQAPVSQGVVVGVNIGGTISNQVGQSGAAAGQTGIVAALAQARRLIGDAVQAGSTDLADDLGAVVTALELALKAEREDRRARRDAKLDEARAIVARLVPYHFTLVTLAASLAQIDPAAQ